MYKHVSDVDLYVGMLMEYDMDNADSDEDEKFVGPSIACIIGDQFLRLKIGDRFFYENENQPSSFTNGIIMDIFGCPKRQGFDERSAISAICHSKCC